MVKKLIVVVVFMALNTGALANVDSVAVDSLGYPVSKPIPWDIVVGKYRKLATVSQKCFVMVEKGTKSEGVIGYTHWAKLEKQVRQWAVDDGAVYIVKHTRARLAEVRGKRILYSRKTLKEQPLFGLQLQRKKAPNVPE